MSQNGGDWGTLDYKQVVLSGSVGFLSGGLGTITGSLSVAASLTANTLGSAAIGAGQQVALNLLNDECSITNNVMSSALRGGLFGFAGTRLGVAANSYRAIRSSNGFINRNSFLNTSNSVSAPYYPPLSSNWAPGGTVTGNIFSNLVSNANQ